MKTLNGLVYSRKFWIAVFALLQTIVFHLLPNFPSDIWQAIDGLCITLIAAIAIEDHGKANRQF